MLFDFVDDFKAHDFLWQKNNFLQQAFAFSMAFCGITKYAFETCLEAAPMALPFIGGLHFASPF